MKKYILILCALMLFLSACAPKDGSLNEDENNDGVDEPIDDNNTGANANNDNFDSDEKTLTGTAQGYGGEISVTVVVNGEDIVSVEAMGKEETEGVGSIALEQLPDKIEAADSTDVDDISGATKTSQGIKQAVNNALKNAAQSKKNQP